MRGDPWLSWPARPSASSGDATRSSASRRHTGGRRTNLGLRLQACLHLQVDAQEGGGLLQGSHPGDMRHRLRCLRARCLHRRLGGFGSGDLVHGGGGLVRGLTQGVGWIWWWWPRMWR
jgi:hypothetical protein